MSIPTPNEIANNIQVTDNGYNGYPTLAEAYLKLIPHEEMSDSRVEALFRDVKRAFVSPTGDVPKTHWTLAA